MKKFIAICISSFVFLSYAFAQMDVFIAPMSTKLPPVISGNINEVKLPPFPLKEVQQLDYNESKNGHMPAIARHIATDISLSNAGTWTNVTGWGAIWRVQITSTGALGLIPLFDRLYLPPGATLHVYMPGKEEILGAFTHDNTPGPRAFCCGLVHGESCIVEYYEPAAQKGQGVVSINKVGHAYRWVNPLSKSLRSGSGSCEVNVVCSEGDNWRNQIRSVARILVIGETVDGYCSGAMINNVRKDCTPYMLSAEHCIENGVSTADYQQWVFYFNYQAANCTDSTGPETDVANGCKKIADSEDGGGNSGSDFLLLQLLNAPPLAYNIFYEGWDITNTTPVAGADIHHPNADIKKISTYTSPAISTSWGNIAQNTHWQVQWAATANGDGVTEPGSSGSPLHNSNGLVVGHLTGGSSCCTVGACSTNFPTGPTLPDLFGRLAYDWTSDGVTPAVQLKPWLDPDNTGATTLQGMNPPCGNSYVNDAGIQIISEPSGNVCSSDIAPVIVLRNFGSNSLTSVTLTYRFDNGALNTYNWTGTLFAGSTTDVTLPSSAFSSGSHTLTIFTTDPNNTTDPNLTNDTASSAFYVSNPGGSLNLELVTDTAGRKTTWQITDAVNNVVASGGPYPDLAGGATYNIPFCLPLACYTFTIFSAQGNGIDAGLQGNFVLTGNAGTVTYASLNNPSFGNSEVHSFCVLPSAVSEIPAIGLSVIPNPSAGQFNIVTGNNEMKKLQVYDITGRLIMERNNFAQNIILDLSAESKGVYILQVETNNGKAVQKLVLK